MRHYIIAALISVSAIAHGQVKETIIRMTSATDPIRQVCQPGQLIRYDSALYYITHQTTAMQTLQAVLDSGWTVRVGDGNSAGTWTDNGNEKQTSVRDTIVAPVWYGNYWVGDARGWNMAYLRVQGGTPQMGMQAGDGTSSIGMGGEVLGDDSYIAMSVLIPSGQRLVQLDSTGFHNQSTPVNLGTSTYPWDTVFYSALYPPIAGPDSSVYATRYYVDTSVVSRVYNVMVNPGDMIRLSSDGVPERLAVGTNGQVLTSNGTLPAWSTPAWSSQDSVPWRRDNTRATTSLRYPSDKVHIGAATTPDSTLKVTGSVNVTRGMNVGYDMKVNGLTVGSGKYKGAGSGTNTALGYTALASSTSANGNTAIGGLSLNKITTGGSNTALGYYSMYRSTTGTQNVAIGNEVLGSNTMNGSSNTGVGYQALTLNTTGYSNTAIGVRALYSNTTGKNLVAVGDSALYKSTGEQNTAIGSKALYNLTTNTGNTAVGYNAGYGNTGGSNTFMGYRAGVGSSSGSYNSFFGYEAGSAATGISNSFFGYQAGTNNTGTRNVALGMQAAISTSSGSNNTAVGYGALRGNTTASYNIALGDSAGFSYTTLSNRMYLGARDTTGTTGGIYFDRTSTKRWGKWMGTLKVTNIPADGSPDSVLTVVDGLIKRAAFPTGGSGTVTSISQGTGMLNSADPITTTGTIGVDTSKVVMFTDTAATGGKIATSYALTTGLAGKQAAGSYVTSVGATSPVASSGGTTPTVSINTDTLTAWHTKQNQGATAYSWGNPAGVYEPIIDPVPIAPGNYYAKHDGAGQTGWQEFPAIPAAYDTLTNPWKYLSGNTVQRAAGNVGIGTTAPTAKVHISAPKAVALAISTDNDGSLGDSTAIYVNSRGYVGVGTASPVRAFHCFPNAQFDNLIYFGGTANTLYSSGMAPSYNGVFKFSNESSGANSAFSFSTKATEAMRISPDQRIGIGTTTPTELLSLGGNAARKFWMERHTTANTAGNSLTIQAGGATSGATDKLGGPINFYPGVSTGNATGTAYSWYTYDAGGSGTSDQTATAKMTMTSAGNVGIGLSNPSFQLHTSGDINAGASLFANNGTGDCVVGTLSRNSGRLNVYSEDDMTFSIDKNNNDADTRSYTWMKNTPAVTGTELMRLTETGRLGIGTTAPATSLQIASVKTSALAISTDYDGSLGDSTAVYVDAAGRVGIGTTGTLSQKLNVSGNVYVTGDITLTGKLVTGNIDPLFWIGADTNSIDTASRYFIGYSQGFVIDSLVFHVERRSGSPDVTAKIYYGSDLNGTGTAVVTAGNQVNTYTGATRTGTINNATVAKGNAVWMRFSAVAVKPKAIFVTIIGHKI